MNSYRLCDLSKGVSESFEVTVTDEMLDSFARMTGDVNPLHNSEDFAKSRGFPGRIAFGMLCASFFSTLAGVYLPGEHCLLHRIDIKFRKPVLIGDRLTVSGVVSDVSEALSVVTVKAAIVNQRGEKISTAVFDAGVID